ncbi:MAG TPA: universal stress protein, partial [Candidatus Sulfopaludibacter sp.]|nr:universal stress protein [Candidatus Sulfopaludibacter sp.]
EATAALRAASRLLTKTDCQFDVLYVAPAARVPKSSAIAQRAFQHRASAEARRILESAKQALAEEGVDALTLSETGSPAGVIMTEADDYDLTVIGAKGRELRTNAGLGPVASRVVEHANGCVLVGREPPQDRQARILVPVDGSAGSKHALDALNEFFDLESAEVTLLHVLETLWLPESREEESLGAGDIDFAQSTQVLAELRREAEQLVADAHARVAEHHPGVTTNIREGVPANEILSEADQGDYDLVVVGANEANDMKHSVLGSVSSKVAWNAPCSVLVVRVPE